MKKNEIEALQTNMNKLDGKLDLIFSLVSNDHLGKQALSVHGAMNAELQREDGMDEEKKSQVLKVMEQALESYKFHSQSVTDAVEYYARIHGDAAQDRLEAEMVIVREKAGKEAAENISEDDIKEALKTSEAKA